VSGKNTDTPAAGKGFARLAKSKTVVLPEWIEDDLSLPVETEEESADDGVDDVQDDHPVPHNPLMMLVADAIEVATRRVQAIDQYGTWPSAVTVSVPTAEWVDPVRKFFCGAFARKWSVYARDGSNRRIDVPTTGNTEVAAALAEGKSVVGIAVAVDQTLPATLTAAADLRLKISLDNKLVSGVIAKLYAGPCPPIDDTDLLRLSLNDLVAAMRPGIGAKDVVSRIANASKTRGGSDGSEAAPDLHTAVEWGAAREWGLALARDMRDFSVGIIPWSAVDRGAVFYSGPGMGKSLLARSLARACNAALVTGSIGELFATSPGHLDGVIKAMRELFARATASAPCILFIDEIDGLPSRESLDSRNRDWWMPVIEDFMLLLDDATSVRREGIVVIGATNRIGSIDPAIMRPGRLERGIEILPPGPDGILNILRFHTRGSMTDKELVTVVGHLEGATPAEIMEMVRRANRLARQAGHALSIGDLRGVSLSAPDLSIEMLRRIAIHESGHVVAAIECGVGRVTSVRIGGRGGAGGLTSIDRGAVDLITRSAMERDIIALLAGRAAEIVLLGAASAGAGGSAKSDLGIATRMLAALNLSYGLGDDALSFIADAEEAHRQLLFDASLRRQIDDTLKRLQARAVSVITRHRAQVMAVAEALMKRCYLSEAEITAILAQNAHVAKLGEPEKLGAVPS
jgi:cell division protease FtsH